MSWNRSVSSTLHHEVFCGQRGSFGLFQSAHVVFMRRSHDLWQVLVRRQSWMKYFATPNGLIAGFSERSRQRGPVGPDFSEVVDELPALRVRGSAARQEGIAAGRAERLLSVRPRERDRLLRERCRPRRHDVITAVAWQLWSQVVGDDE